MKFFSLLLTITAFLGLTVAQGNIPAGSVPCTPTGAGTCTLGVAGLIQGQTVYWYWLRIYNNACQEIGGVNMANGDQLGFNLPRSIYSQLPWTLELDHIHPSLYHELGFRYSSFSWRGTAHCRREYNPGYGLTIHMCQKAFPC